MPRTMKCAEQDDRRFHIDTEQARDYPRTLESSTGSRRHACNFELWISPGNLAPHQLTAVGPFYRRGTSSSQWAYGSAAPRQAEGFLSMAGSNAIVSG